MGQRRQVRSNRSCSEDPLILHRIDNHIAQSSLPLSLAPTMATDPSTGRPLPDNAIQRITFLTPTVHVYGIPPLNSNAGFSAASWTAPPRPTAQQIFTARLRIIETSIDSKLKIDIVLEDANSGELFAAAPYTSTAVVQQANDSSRFFAIRVVGEGGMKATLGLGFEDRAPALDFNIALGEARKVLSLDGTQGAQKGAAASKAMDEAKQDFSLKEGEKIHISVGSKGRRGASPGTSNSAQDDGAALFSIAPPPGAAKAAEPPHTSEADGKSAKDLGFDDGEFGEFV